MSESPAVAPSAIAEFEFPNLEGKRLFDCATVPGELRLDFLKTALRQHIANRLNSVHNRYAKDEAVIAWTAYDEASKADPLQAAVAKPEGERPAAPDYAAAYDRAVAALVAGTIRRQSDEPKQRKAKDPLIATVTSVVEREVFAARKALNAKYSFLEARKEVGGDGIAYLNAMIETKVAAGSVRADLEKMRDEKYIKPAQAMLGLTTGKALSALPSIL